MEFFLCWRNILEVVQKTHLFFVSSHCTDFTKSFSLFTVQFVKATLSVSDPACPASKILPTEWPNGVLC